MKKPMILSFFEFVNEKLHTLKDANTVLEIFQQNISNKSTLLGGFSKGKETSDHDIDILVPDLEFNEELKLKIFKLLNAKSVEDTDWGGWYFNDTDYGDVDVFYTTEDFDY